jgi:hypothetical protein
MNCAHAQAVSTALFDAVSAAADTVPLAAALLPVRPCDRVNERMRITSCITIGCSADNWSEREWYGYVMTGVDEGPQQQR